MSIMPIKSIVNLDILQLRKPRHPHAVFKPALGLLGSVLKERPSPTQTNTSQALWELLPKTPSSESPVKGRTSRYGWIRSNLGMRKE